MKAFLVSLLLALPVAVLAQPATPLPARTQAEIDHLIKFIAKSECRFNRNGSWHGMVAARTHVNAKYEYLVERGQIDSAEAFIEKAASQSSLSGMEYLVECPGSTAMPSATWLKNELVRYRRPGS